MAVETITTVQGQAWDQLSKASYGSEKLLDAIVTANADEADMVLFPGDTALAVPAAVKSVDTATLPPWERT